MECRRVCHVNGAAGHCRLVEGIPLLQLGEDVKTHQVNDDLTIGIGNYAPFGLSTNYEGNFQGRYFGVDILP